MSLDPDRIGAARAVRLGTWQGRRDERVEPATLQAALAAWESPEPVESTLKDDARSRVCAVRAGSLPLVGKEVRKAGPRRRLADLFRGSPAARAFARGRWLVEAGIGAALPVAFLERRRLGMPTRSLLFSLDLRPAPTARTRLADAPAERSALLQAMADLVAALHRAGVRHGDLRAQHVYVGVGTPPRLRLIDLESVRIGRRPGDAARLADWAQLCASISDEEATELERRQAFERYAQALPFAAGTEDSFARLLEASRSRGDRYRGKAPKRDETAGP